MARKAKAAVAEAGGETRELKAGEKIALKIGPVSAADLRVADVPEFYGSQVQAFVSSNDFTIVLARQVPMAVQNIPHMSNAAVMSPVVTLHFSPETAKDLSILLVGLLAGYEKDWGTIETTFSRKRAAEKKEASAASAAKH